MARLTLDNVTKVFDDDGEQIVAVDDVDIDIEDGEFLVLVGPSGCGKSTTLRMIAGLEDVTTGELRIDGEVVNDVPATKRNIAMVFQSYALYPHMTVRGNMAFGLEESTDLPDHEIRQRVEEAADLLGIPELLDRKPDELSGGQQQRVALGRAIVRDPEVFLMDEPLANLDAKLRAEMRTELPAAPARPGRDDGLRHAQSGRGDDHGRPGRHLRRGRPPAVCHATGVLPRAEQPLRRRVHRRTVDELSR